MDEMLTVEVMLHEYLHKALPHIEEEKIDQMGSEMATMLHRAGLIAEEDE